MSLNRPWSTRVTYVHALNNNFIPRYKFGNSLYSMHNRYNNIIIIIYYALQNSVDDNHGGQALLYLLRHN